MSGSFDIEAFKAFVASKPADEKYDGCDPYECALAQFGLPCANVDSVPSDIFWASVFSGSIDDKPPGWSRRAKLARAKSNFFFGGG